MKQNNGLPILALMIITGAWLFAGGCDSGNQAIDEATGRRAVKQYQESKQKIDQIAEKQAERYDGIPDEKNKENGNKD